MRRADAGGSGEARPDAKMSRRLLPKRNARYGTAYAYDHGYIKPAKSGLRQTMKKIANAKRRRRDKATEDE